MLRSISVTVISMTVVGLSAGTSPPPIPLMLAEPKLPPLPVGDKKQPVITLVDDDAHLLIPYLTNDEDYNNRATASVEELDVYSGASALRVGPLQRFRAEVPGWSFPIREKPEAGEFRYIGFAWKKIGGTSITMQIHTTEPAANWRQMNYYAGKKFFGWNLVQVSETMPTEWTVVTRDLFKDFGNRTITGLAYVTTDGTAGLFDHVMLGRTVEDLDKASEAAMGKVKPEKALAGKERDAAWVALQDRSPAKAAPALRQFLASSADQVNFIREKLGQGPTPEQRKEQAEKVTKLINELGSESFEAREVAETALTKMEEVALSAILTAITSDTPEIQFRAKRILKAWKSHGDALLSEVRAVRVIRILERAATPEAKALLKEMSKGGFGADFQKVAKGNYAKD